jgi:hypothetical protein
MQGRRSAHRARSSAGAILERIGSAPASTPAVHVAARSFPLLSLTSSGIRARWSQSGAAHTSWCGGRKTNIEIIF